MSSRPDPGKPSRSWYALIIATAILTSAVIAFYIQGGMSDLERLEQKKQQLLEENTRLQRQAEELELRRRRLHEDPHLIEDLARERLGLARPGEKTVTFRETGPDTSVEENNTDTPTTAGETGALHQQRESEALPFGEPAAGSKTAPER